MNVKVDLTNKEKPRTTLIVTEADLNNMHYMITLPKSKKHPRGFVYDISLGKVLESTIAEAMKQAKEEENAEETMEGTEEESPSEENDTDSE